MVKDFSWNIIPWNALLFEKTLKQLSILDIENYGFILNTCHDTAKRAETRVGFPVIFSRLRWPIEPKFSQVCYFIYKLWYTKCGPLDNTVYRKCPMALNGRFKPEGLWHCDKIPSRRVTMWCAVIWYKKNLARVSSFPSSSFQVLLHKWRLYCTAAGGMYGVKPWPAVSIKCNITHGASKNWTSRFLSSWSPV